MAADDLSENSDPETLLITSQEMKDALSEKSQVRGLIMKLVLVGSTLCLMKTIDLGQPKLSLLSCIRPVL